MKEATGASFSWGVVLIILGIAAMFLPAAAGIGVSVFVGWLIVFGGFATIASAFAARGAGGFLWRLLVGIVYVSGGLFLLFNPGIALATLTLVMAILFFLEGIFEIAIFFQFRSLSGSGWILFNGIITLVLAYLIWRPWPSSSVWAIGTILGINLITSGITRVVYAGTARQVMSAVS
jgi:uncharacterized membrane protein HdeD (DUF308 family)